MKLYKFFMKRIKVITLAALAIMTASCNDNDDIADIENVKPVEIVNGQENGFDYADLGLSSGTLWATCNVGATSPEQAGLYFAWGETTGYTAEQVKNGERSFDSSNYTASAISADLTLEEDAAHVHMGGDWRMPTQKDFEELIDNTTQTWTDNYNGTGVGGCVVTSKTNSNSIFLPAAGNVYRDSLCFARSYGFYWSASWGSSSYAWFFSFYWREANSYNYYRYNGRSVRGVLDSNVKI